MVKGGILIIGDEILIGQIRETNGQYLSEKLFEAGFITDQIRIIADSAEGIKNALDDFLQHVDFVIITGGLGPTNDDLTKKTLSEYFDAPLVENEDVLRHITELYENLLNRPLNKLTRTQAMVPKGFEALKNDTGTAPGLWFEKEGKIIVAVPGVPFEMKHLFHQHILPRLLEKFGGKRWWRKDLMTYGIPESELAIKLEKWEEMIPAKLAYLPNGARIKLRLMSEQPIQEKDWSRFLADFRKITGKYFLGEGSEDFDVRVAEWLKTKNQTIAVAESCTGGALAAAFTKRAGSSAYFKGGVVSYAAEVKTNTLDIAKEIIDKHTVVSEMVAVKMAENVRRKLHSDFGISTTGVAGPDKGEDGKPVGTVWIGFSTPEDSFASHFHFRNQEREGFIQRVVRRAFEEFYLRITGKG